MDPAVLIVAFIVLAPLLLCVFHVRAEKKLRARLDAQFGKPAEPRDFEEDVSALWRARQKYENPAHCIDDTTWNDLEMDKLYRKINACQTSVGEEWLYALLREPCFERAPLERREALMALLEANPALRLDLQVCLAKMGKAPGNGLSAFCYDISSRKIKHPWLYNTMAALPPLCAAVLALNAGVGAALTAAALIANGVAYYRAKKRLDAEMESVRYFASLLWCARKTPKLLGDAHPVARDVREGFAPFKSLGGRLSGMTRERLSELDAIVEYFRILTLQDIRSYNRVTALMERHQGALRQMHRGIGELDAMIAVLSYRASLPYYCRPAFISENRVTTEDICHPLLQEPVPNSAKLRRSCLVSGSNASGKSTFIKAVALCGLLAQTINTCTARRYETRFALVMTSMAVRDDIEAGESYFITEIKSLRRILQKIPKVFCVCFIDEILRGTNTTERIAASAAVLERLSAQNCLCVVATHDIELTRLLTDRCDNFHFCEQMDARGIRFDYTIRPGPSRTRNAILLLDHLGFDKSVTDAARALVARFERTQRWDG